MPMLDWVSSSKQEDSTNMEAKETSRDRDNRMSIIIITIIIMSTITESTIGLVKIIKLYKARGVPKVGTMENRISC